MQADNNAVGKNSKVFCGLYVPALKNGNNLTKAMKAAFKGGADGIAFFNLNALNDDLLKQISCFSTKHSLQNLDNR